MDKFPNFLSSSAQYKKAELYWSNLCEEILSDLGQLSLWKDWLKVEFVDGTPFLDGNPIYSLSNRKNNLALRIIQVEFEQEGAMFDSWVDDAEIDGEVYKELVVYCSVCTDNEDKIHEAVRSWFEEKIDMSL